MSSNPTALWLNANRSFKPFEAPLLRYLHKCIAIARWEYIQSADEGSSLEVALEHLHDYLAPCDRPLHLLGHGTGGLLGLLYARQYPERVESLTLLGVGAYPAVDWQAHYYRLRQLLPCDRAMILAQMVRNLFGAQNYCTTKALIEILDKDLLHSPSPHSLYQRTSIAPGSLEVPLLACGSADDVIVDRNALNEWRVWMKSGDVLWTCPRGHHFFHYFQSGEVGRQIVKFWHSLSPEEVRTCTEEIAR
ncbi:MAG: alpha/beta fold hydrolase [Cyanobacteriota bacterium]|nr:alpha/beta fold hydrolase [Cyanobacteriota bacterium]